MLGWLGGAIMLYSTVLENGGVSVRAMKAMPWAWARASVDWVAGGGGGALAGLSGAI